MQKLREKLFAGIPAACALRSGKLVEIKNISVEFQQRQSRTTPFGLFDMAVHHDQAWTIRRLCQNVPDSAR